MQEIMKNKEDLDQLLKRLDPFANGCFSGDVSEWPQLKPLLRDCYKFLCAISERDQIR